MIELDSVKQPVGLSQGAVEALVKSIDEQSKVNKSVLDLLMNNEMLVQSQAGFNNPQNETVELLQNISDKVSDIEQNGGVVGPDGMVSGAMLLNTPMGPVKVELDEGQVESTLTTMEEAQREGLAKVQESTEDGIRGLVTMLKERMAEQLEAIKDNTRETKESGEKVQSSLGESSKNVKSLSGNLEKMVRDIRQGNVGGAADSLSKTGEQLQNAGDMLGGVGRLAGVGNVLGSIGGILTKLAPAGMALGAATAVGAALGEGIDLFQDARSASINQNGGDSDMGLGASMKMQAMLTGYTTGLDQKDVENIQNNLIKGRAKYGTEEYDEGFGFAMNAATNYNMEAGKAAQFYTDNVVKGGMAVSELNNVLGSLAETVKNSDVSMEEAMADFEKNVQTLSRSMGSDSAGTQVASEIQQMFEGDQDAANAATNMVNQVDWTGDAYANTRRMEYVAQGYSNTEAMVATAREMQQQGLLGGNPEKYLASMPLTDNDSRRFWDYVQEGDSEGLANALENLSASWQQVGGLVTIRSALGSFGYSQEKLGTDRNVQPLVDTVMGMESTMYDMASKNASDQEGMGADAWSGIKNAWGDSANIVFTGEGGYYYDNTDAANAVNQSAKDRNFSNEETRHKGLSYLASSGLLSDELGAQLSENEATELLEGLGKMYNDSGDSRDFTAWVRSSEARSEVENYISKYDASGAGGSESSANVNVELSWADDADQILYSKVKAEERRRGQDDG